MVHVDTRLINVVFLGRVDYSTGLELQQTVVHLVKQGRIGHTLLLLEHSPVITLGRNVGMENIIASRDFLSSQGIELFETDRGGDVTFHGPGQLVGYPIFDLRGYATDLSSRTEESRDLASPARKYLGAVDFVRRLEEVLIRACADFSIETKRIPGL